MDRNKPLEVWHNPSNSRKNVVSSKHRSNWYLTRESCTVGVTTQDLVDLREL